ncbi:hypothetical protein CONPUDRAFT_169161 [Coniophora puteana RWD-64-598 SS2]|uniref:Uncharacterized protein n=1 Tax=Coniophora puteana (strain RWD-64-598) TaxID=741705 RepID=A0A5M3M9F9_CONPW|nr:uncharacterized protein CONPUDRAFT_169161 [Coniophora puteana RWD-64-598 SS2]EIW75922.1 hypothetical protein CONPUDRAFT_169161 [Coniophora puteana RWD-64-598 SS2]
MRRHCQKKHLVEKPQVNAHWYKFRVSDEWEFHCERLDETRTPALHAEYRQGQAHVETQPSALISVPFIYKSAHERTSDESFERYGAADISPTYGFNLHESFGLLELDPPAPYHSLKAPPAFDPQTIFNTKAMAMFPPSDEAITSLLAQVYSCGFADAQSYSAHQQVQQQTNHLFNPCSPSTSTSDKCMHCWLAAYYGIPCDLH